MHELLLCLGTYQHLLYVEYLQAGMEVTSRGTGRERTYCTGSVDQMQTRVSTADTVLLLKYV